MRLVEDLGPVVVREGVVYAGIGEELHVLTQSLQLLFELAHRLRVGEVVVLCVVAQDRGLELRVVGLRSGPRDDAVIRHRRLHQVGPERREPEREPAPDAEPGHADAVAGHGGVALQVVDGPDHVLGRLLDVERHHHLRCLVRLLQRGLGAAVQVWREGDEPFGRVPVAHLLDLLVETPPLLDHHDPRALPTVRYRQVALRLTTVARERHDLAHQYAPPNLLWSQLRIFSGFTTITTRLALIARTPSRTVSFSGPQ